MSCPLRRRESFLPCSFSLIVRILTRILFVYQFRSLFGKTGWHRSARREGNMRVRAAASKLSRHIALERQACFRLCSLSLFGCPLELREPLSLHELHDILTASISFLSLTGSEGTRTKRRGRNGRLSSRKKAREAHRPRALGHAPGSASFSYIVLSEIRKPPSSTCFF